MITKERFSEICKEYGYTDRHVDILWNHPARVLMIMVPDDEMETRIREACQAIRPEEYSELIEAEGVKDDK